MPRGLASNRSASSNRVSVQNFPCSLGFNGSSSKIVATAITGFSSGFTVAFWYKQSNNVFGKLVANATGASDEFAIATNTNGTISSSYFNGTTTFSVSSSVTAIQYASWNHIVFIFNGAAASMYVNGVLQSGVGSVSLASTSNFTIGCRNDSSQFFIGSMGQVLVYKRAISIQEVMNLYQNIIIPSVPFAYYPLTEGAGTTAYDISGNANNGTITAGTYTADVPSKTRGLVGGNLVYNGNFEFAPVVNVATTVNAKWIDGTSGGNSTTNIFGWAVEGLTGSGAAMFDNTVSHSGNYSMKVSTTATGSVISVLNIINSGNTSVNGIPILPSTAYTLSVWIKTQANSGSSTGGAIFQAAEKNASGGTQASNPTVGITTTQGWTQFIINFTTQSGSRFLTPVLQVAGNTGTSTLIMDAWYDNIELYPTSNSVRNLV